MSFIPGTYKHERDENFAELVNKRCSEIPEAKALSKMRPKITISESDDQYRMVSVTPQKTFDWTFKIGEEVELEGPTGLKKHIFSLDDNKLTQTPLSEDEAALGIEVTHEFSEEGFRMVYLHSDSGESAVRIFKRVQYN